MTFDGRKIMDITIQKYIVAIKNCKTSKRYGYRKVTAQLREEYNLRINKKKVRRLMIHLNLLGDTVKRS